MLCPLQPILGTVVHQIILPVHPIKLTNAEMTNKKSTCREMGEYSGRFSQAGRARVSLMFLIASDMFDEPRWTYDTLMNTNVKSVKDGVPITSFIPLCLDPLAQILRHMSTPLRWRMNFG